MDIQPVPRWSMATLTADAVRSKVRYVFIQFAIEFRRDMALQTTLILVSLGRTVKVFLHAQGPLVEEGFISSGMWILADPDGVFATCISVHKVRIVTGGGGTGSCSYVKVWCGRGGWSRGPFQGTCVCRRAHALPKNEGSANEQ